MSLSRAVVLPARPEAVVRRAGAWAPGAAVAALLAWWATYLTWGSGGREPHVLSIGSVLLALALVAVRPWVVPPAALVLTQALVGAAWVVVLTAPTGAAGTDDAASWTFAAESGLAAYAWARTPLRRQVLLTAVVGAAGAQFALGWLPWWGMQDPTRLFQGTFYWHNQAGIFLAAGAVLALAAVAAGRPVSLLGWALAPFCVAGTVYTTSRGSELALGLGVGVLMVLLRRRRLHVLATLALAGVVTWALTGPPFFADRISPVAGTANRSASLVGNGVQRFEDWRRAYEIFLHWPLSGAGFNSFDSAAGIATTRQDTVRTAFAHNGYLQAAADGGLVLFAPLVLLLAVVVVRMLSDVPQVVRERDAVRAGGVSAVVILLLHSGMDFDWGYPSLLAMLALVSVLALPAPGPVAAGRRSDRLGQALVAFAVVLLVVGAVGGWSGGLDLSTAVT